MNCFRAVTAAVAFLAICTRCGECDGADGREKDFWAGHSVIVAVVVHTTALAGAKPLGTHAAVLRPLATLAGPIDPSAQATLRVTLIAGPKALTSIPTPPEDGATILVVVSDDHKVVSDICTFMPGDSSLVSLAGLDDKRIVETASKIRRARDDDDKPAKK